MGSARPLCARNSINGQRRSQKRIFRALQGMRFWSGLAAFSDSERFVGAYIIRGEISSLNAVFAHCGWITRHSYRAFRRSRPAAGHSKLPIIAVNAHIFCVEQAARERAGEIERGTIRFPTDRPSLVYGLTHNRRGIRSLDGSFDQKASTPSPVADSADALRVHSNRRASIGSRFAAFRAG